jgi:ABC-type sugar transport system ATPase subunit
MDEIFRLCDAVTVLRDGRHVATRPLSGLAEADLVQMMIGRPLEPAEARAGSTGEDILRVTGLSSPGKFRDVSFSVRAGEVLGLAGLVGAGRSEIAEALFGLDPAVTGEVLIGGNRARIETPAQAMALGIGLVPEDRKRQGLVLQMSAQGNTTLPVLEQLARATFIRSREERALVASFFDRLRVKAQGFDASAASLSGGNQQKLVLAKWLAAKARILILDEPTRGVDVGAKAEIHALIDQLAREGNAILLISSELPELLRLASRIVVIREGGLVGEVPGARATQDGLLRLMAGLAA